MRTSIAFQIDIERRHLREIRSDLDEVKRILAIRQRERKDQDIECRLAALRFQRALKKYVDSCRKAGFNPNQPRVPAGSREGGQWTHDSGEGSRYGGSTSRTRVANATGDSSPASMNDATPDPIISGAQYAQAPINIDTSALTGISTIDNTTKQLATTLARIKDSVEYLPTLTPQGYGRAVHTAFAAAVRVQGLRGIAPSDVETTFGGNRYGAKGSIRTDVVLRNDVGDVIAIYDVKTAKRALNRLGLLI